MTIAPFFKKEDDHFHVVIPIPPDKTSKDTGFNSLGVPNEEERAVVRALDTSKGQQMTSDALNRPAREREKLDKAMHA